MTISGLAACCGSTRWLELLEQREPFRDIETLQAAAADVWWSLDEKDWLEAFASHPKIGENRNLSQWSSEEQSGMASASASADAAVRMRELNLAYEKKFGWIFIVCATGKTAGEMQSELETRLQNQPEAEIRIAAGEQAKIMKLRIEKLLAQ